MAWFNWFRGTSERSQPRKFVPTLEGLGERICPVINPGGINPVYSPPPVVITGVSGVTDDDNIVINQVLGGYRIVHHRGQFHWDPSVGFVPDAGTTPTLVRDQFVMYYTGIRFEIFAGDG